jgi:hypothetical protein
MTNSRQDPTQSVIIRLASCEDGELLEHLAALDSARRPVGPVLIAERDGHPVAALALSDDRPIADPFLPTADVVELLRLRARQVQPAGERRLFRWASASGKPVRDARNRLHRLLEGSHVTV